MDNGISANGSSNGSKSGLTGTSANGDSSTDSRTSGTDYSNGGSGSNSSSGSNSQGSESFTFPLPRRTPGSHVESGQHSTPDENESYTPTPERAPSHSEPETATPTETARSTETTRSTETARSTAQSAAEPAAQSTYASAEPVQPTTDFEALGRTVMRRKSMGEAAVRIAGRLAQAELLQNTGNPTADADQLLTLLGEYLTAAGFENPEIRAKLAGQSIFIDLASPQQ